MDYQLFYASLARELDAKLRRLSAFVDHAPSSGTYHEIVLASTLRALLSDRFSIRTGFAFHSTGGPSKQGDILIIDESHPTAYHFREGNFAIVNPDALVCVIEVKTRLTKSTFHDAMTCLYSFRKLPSTTPTITFLFAYESQPFTERALQSWYSGITTIPDQIDNYPWGIFALNQGVIILRRESSSAMYGHCKLHLSEARGPKLRGLSVFLQTIRKALLLHSQQTVNPFNDAAGGTLEYDKYAYRFGSTGAA